jgi:hypothetical protein
MEIYELDNNFQPKTELGKEMKMMVENGDHCDGNIYWLIQLIEQKQDEIKEWNKFKKDADTLFQRQRLGILKLTEERDGAIADRDYWKEKYLLLQRQ